MRVAVTGAAGSVGHRVCRVLGETLDYNVLAIDRRPLRDTLLNVDPKIVDLSAADLGAVLEGSEVLVHLASGMRPDAASAEEGASDLRIATRLFRAASESGIEHLVVVSTSMVYGAWPESPLPLTEDAPVRPNEGYSYAVHRAELEGLARDWQRDNPEAVLTILRPAVTVAEEKPGGLAKILQSAAVIRTEEAESPGQFLHADDLATAIATVVRDGVNETLNVAPDGWIPADNLAALEGPLPRVWLPARTARLLARLLWKLGLTKAPPGVIPYTMYSWVVSNDRIRSLGWEPTHSNEEAWVAGHAPGPLDMMNARRRQQLTLGAVAVVGIGAAVGLGALVVRARRHRS